MSDICYIYDASSITVPAQYFSYFSKRTIVSQPPFPSYHALSSPGSSDSSYDFFPRFKPSAQAALSQASPKISSRKSRGSQSAQQFCLSRPGLVVSTGPVLHCMDHQMYRLCFIHHERSMMKCFAWYAKEGGILHISWQVSRSHKRW